MANPLFDRVLPSDLAENRQHIEFKGKVADFERLVEIAEAELSAVSSDRWPRRWRAAPVEIRLDFAWMDAEQQIPTVSGRASAQIPMVCQRCLEVFGLSLDASLKMLLVRPNVQYAELAGFADYEVWETEEKALRPFDIVEESLVMAMPLAPRHESEVSCGALAAEIAESGLKMAHPFADLRSQMEKSDT